jgi:hypothetical protein
MEQKIKELLDYILNEKIDYEELKEKANEILDDEFKKEVIEEFGWIKYDISVIQEIVNGDKIEFLHQIYYYYRNSANNFVKNNFNRLDEIIKILQEYIQKNDCLSVKTENEKVKIQCN